MLKNHFRTAWRNIARNKTYSFINIFGLALGISICIAIFLITNFEFSTDNFHPHKDRIYRLLKTTTNNNKEVDRSVVTPKDIAHSIREKCTGIETIAGYNLFPAKINAPESDHPTTHYDNWPKGGKQIPSTILAEPEYLSILQYEWLAGNPATALKHPYSVVLTESAAAKYFGNLPPNQLIGRKLSFNDSIITSVTGIIKDWKTHTSFPFTEFISFSTAQHLEAHLPKSETEPIEGLHPAMARTIIMLAPGVSPARLTPQLQPLAEPSTPSSPDINGFELQPLSGIHFDDKVWDGLPKAHRATLYVLIGIASFILLLAAINFINLSTALSIRRAKEIGIRKVMGGSKTNIGLQFLTETFLLTTAALLLALIAIKPLLSIFNTFIPVGLTSHLFDPENAIFIIGLLLITTLLAGCYPARVLAAYLPVLSLKGANPAKGQKKWYFRKALIIFQFSISLIFIITTVIISRQINYMRTQDLGFSTDAIITLEGSAQDKAQNMARFSEQVQHIAGIQTITRQSFTPLSTFETAIPVGYKDKKEQTIQSGLQLADSNFIRLYDIRLLAGRNISMGINRDTIKEFLINEALSRSLGFNDPQQAIGKFLYFGDQARPIVGVVADFHENSYRQPIRPLVIFDLAGAETSTSIKLASKNKNLASVKNTLTQIEKIWNATNPGFPFYYHFLDDSIAALYDKEQKTATLMNLATAVTILISFMGLFGLSLFSAGQRTKEIGIRKVLGASVLSITKLLTRDFVILIGLSLLIAAPIAWYISHRWLEDYLYRAPVTIWIFLLTGFAAILLGLLTVSVQTLKAASANPVKSLRTE